MHRIFKSIFTLALLFLFFTGCKPISVYNNKDSNNDTAPHNQSIDFEKQIEGKYWKLVELEGQQITMAENQQREIHLKLNSAESKVNGFAGCNNFFGSYQLDELAMRIKFSQISTTLMACQGIDDRPLLEVLDLTDNYTMTKDNMNKEILRLNVGRRAPLAVFKAVYFD